MKAVLVALVLVGCGDDPAPDDIVECGSVWDAHAESRNGVTCERICAARSASYGDGPYCDATHSSGRTWTCYQSFEDESGVVGCCYPTPQGDQMSAVEFFECD